MEFLGKEDKFKILIITGKAGTGKSRLVYYTLFKNEDVKKTWSVYGLNYDELQYFTYENICRLTGKKIVKKKILFVIDYVTINAEQIGKWIKSLYSSNKEDDQDICIRILLVERAQLGEGREPYWYIKLVKENRLDNLEVYKNIATMNLEDMSDQQLEEIFVMYIKTNEEKYKKKGIYPDYTRCRKAGREIIEGLSDERCKTPLYIMYIADVWINGNGRNKYNWKSNELLEYVVEKEDRKIKSLFNKDVSCENAFKRILIFVMAFNGLKLKRKGFLDKEFETIRNKSSDSSNLRNLFNEIGKLEDDKEITLKPVFPEIVCEYYFLRYLKSEMENSFDDKIIEEIIQQAWKKNPKDFAGFLCRIIEDFPDHNLVTFENVLQEPAEVECMELYADVLREYTYWNSDVSNYYEAVCAIFDNLLNQINSVTIHEAHAVSLFNMIWWCQQNKNELAPYIKRIAKRISRSCIPGKSCISGSIICTICNTIKEISQE